MKYDGIKVNLINSFEDWDKSVWFKVRRIFRF